GLAAHQQPRPRCGRAGVEVVREVARRLDRYVPGILHVTVRRSRTGVIVGQRRALAIVRAVRREQLNAALPVAPVRRRGASPEPPCAAIQVATDSFAASPTAMTSRRSPSATLSNMRCRCVTIGEIGFWASPRSVSLYCPKIGYTNVLMNRYDRAMPIWLSRCC